MVGSELNGNADMAGAGRAIARMPVCEMCDACRSIGVRSRSSDEKV